MDIESPKQSIDMLDVWGEKSYRHYQDLGGIIDEDDYASAFENAKNYKTTKIDQKLRDRMKQVENIAEFAGIELHSTEDAPDPRIVLFMVLRNNKPGKDEQQNQPDTPKSVYFDGAPDSDNDSVNHPYKQMGDPRLFREVLKMLENADALKKLKTRYHDERRPGVICPLCQQIRYSEDCL